MTEWSSNETDSAARAGSTLAEPSPPNAGEIPIETRGQATLRFARTQKLGTTAGLFIVLLILLAAFAAVVAPFEPTEQNRHAFLAAPGVGNWLGTDDLGRDLLSRIIHGARISLYVGTVTVAVSLFLGVLIGLVAGYIGGAVDGALQALIDAILSIPPIVLALFVASLLGPSISNVIIALVIVTTPRFARVARGEMQRVKSEDYIEAAVVLGASRARVMLRHGLPNMVPALTVVASLGFGNIIIAEAALSFLGIGTPPPEPSWGLMLSQGMMYFELAPWIVIFPGVAISLAVLSFNLFGDALRDFLDPKLIR
ncbi:ABC-type dipeptide/oligopeptide/nickel transport system permease subunit [Lipingzhangella halophila]|uniref:ABC-type dipeptide/oligopeptide/nickel transport system permease subunit n=1 Tax=Lipingzhangella halophila TaxID=1783352 RepID=A0A7W7W1L0_9ACTN|nr:ABC transporter permease [Lipingzhangella halophila]MBB4930433.1 ABC-type dipeptide/oligopeptide/nickel transport system permease subunit [Lipingzhangella halophila]